MKQIYTYNDVCKIINKSRQCVYYLVKQGKFPEPDIILNSRLKYYSRDNLKKYLAEVFKIDLEKWEESNNIDDK